MKEEDTDVTIAQLLNQADAVMYQVKNAMKNDYLVKNFELFGDSSR